MRCLPIAKRRVGKHIQATHAHATIGRLLLGNGAVSTLFNIRMQYFSVGSTPRLYNEDLTRLDFELSRVLKMAVEDD
jgi:hypothetical protein